MRATLTAVKPETPSGKIMTFYFEPEQPIFYTAGQFIELTLPHRQPDARGTMRQFTLSSSPSEPELAITVNFANARSSYKQALRSLKPGDEVSIGEPLGDFVLPLNESIPLIWIAGGIGITPFRSIARWLADQSESREIILFHSVRSPEEVLFTDVLRLAGIDPDKHHIINTATRSRIDVAAVLPNLQAQQESYIYISGPQTMAESLSKDLIANSIEQHRVITDAFLGYN